MFKCIFTVLAVTFTIQANAHNVRFVDTEDVVSTRLSIDGSRGNQSIGRYELQVKGGSPVLGFCVDPYQFASRTYSHYSVYKGAVAADIPNPTRYTNVQKLFDNAYAGLDGDATATAGFHLALWEIFADDLNLETGRVQTVDDRVRRTRRGTRTVPGTGTNLLVESIASTLLSNLDVWEVQNKYAFTFMQSDEKQDFLVPSAVPVPAALPLFLSALAGFGVMRRRKAKAA